MRHFQAAALAILALILFSCKKDHPPTDPPPPPTAVAAKILLKDINDKSQPAPFYHFEYNQDSSISRAIFAAGLADYTIFYSGNKIADMRDMTLVNKDTLRYRYDPQGRLSIIEIIDDDTHLVIRHIVFTFDKDKLTKIERDHKEQSGFLIDNVEQFDYTADGNLKTKIRLLRTATAEFTDTTRYEQYDDKINVDDFDIVNGSINEHLFLFQGFRLQKNNPAKITFTQPGGLNNFIITATYSYNPDNTPSKRTADIFVNGTGPGSGNHVSSERNYSYYTH